MWLLSPTLDANPLLHNLQTSLRVPWWRFLWVFKWPAWTNFLSHSEQENDGGKWLIMWPFSTFFVPNRDPQQSQIQFLFVLCLFSLCSDKWPFDRKSEIEKCYLMKYFKFYVLIRILLVQSEHSHVLSFRWTAFMWTLKVFLLHCVV